MAATAIAFSIVPVFSERLRLAYIIILYTYITYKFTFNVVMSRDVVRFAYAVLCMCDARAPAVPWNHGRLFIIISFFFI